MSKSVSIHLGKTSTIGQPSNAIRISVEGDRIRLNTDYQASELAFVQQALREALRTATALADSYAAIHRRKAK